jgi:aspartate carbamoyltransferase catalytic subunit
MGNALKPLERQTANTGIRHLLSLDNLNKSIIENILDRSEGYLTEPGQLPARDTCLAGRTVANLFFEASTRTRASFELAAKRMSADVRTLMSIHLRGSRAKAFSTPSSRYRPCRPIFSSFAMHQPAFPP